MPDGNKLFPEPDHDLDGTQPVDRIDTSKHLPPPPGGGHVQLPSRADSSRRDKRKRDQRPPPQDNRKSVDLKRGTPSRDRSKSGLYLPAWSVLLMLVTVFVVAFGIIALVIALGGGTQPGGSPRIIIVTAPPSPTSSVLETPSAFESAPLATSSGNQGAFPTFALEGPTLPPVILSPTPLMITVGANVTVNASDGLNVRSGAGLDQSIMFNADGGSVFTVVGGPTQANGLTWWEIRDPLEPTRFGWAAADYLDVQAAQ